MEKPARTETVSRQLKKRKSRWSRKWLITIFAVAIVVIVGAGTTWFVLKPHSLVPGSIQKQVSFPVYYPNPSRLPSGYLLNTASFSVQRGQAVIYTVSYGTNQKLTFSVQAKPTADELANFIQNYIPINHQVLTLVGTATEGSIGKQTVVSLPTNYKSWVLITGPPAIYNTDNLAQVLEAITTAN